MEKRGKSESNAIQMAVGIVKRWCRGGGNVDAGTRAAACKASAEWEAKKARAHAKGALQHSEGKWRMPLLADELALREAALARLAVFEETFGLDGMIGVLGEGALAESAAWSPTLKRTARAPGEAERHEVYDGEQHVGTLSARTPYEAGRGPRWTAFAVNDQRVTDYNTTSRPDALKALQTHLEEAPARVIAMPTAGKFLVAQPNSYSGETTYKQFSSEGAARHAAGLPATPTTPERNTKVEAVAELLRWDLAMVAPLDISPLRRVQEARRRDPFELVAEAFHPSELRDWRGRWQHTGGSPTHGIERSVTSPHRLRVRVPSDAAARYEGGTARASARARRAHAAKPQIKLDDLPGSVGRGSWSTGAERTARDLLAGKVKDTEHAHRARKADGSLGAYSAERKALHERIVSNLLQGKGTHEGSARAIFTAGGPASGKSSLEKHGHLTMPSDVVHANPDVVREMLPEYQALKAAGREDASSLTHEEASHLAKVVTRVALARQHHILVDTVGDSGPGKFAGKVRAAKAAGHQVGVHYTTISSGQAVSRARKRAERTGRHVPESYLRESHAEVSRRFPEVEKIPGIHLRLFDNSGATPRLVAERKPSADKLVIADREAHRAFLAKARG